MGKLNLLYHKSYHPYKAENVAKVKRDEAKARGEEEGKDRRVLVAESEARLDRLRKKKKKGEGDEGEHALERQLTGSSKEVEQLTNDTMIVRPPEKVKEVKKRGHINFWEEFEGDASSGKTVGPNLAAKLEKQLEKEKIESSTKMYLGRNGESGVGWYASSDGTSEKERKAGVEGGLERAYKDGEHKKMSDPLSLMNEYLKKREEIKSGHIPAPHSRRSLSYHERYPTPATPSSSTAVTPSLLLPRRRHGEPLPQPSMPPPLPPTSPAIPRDVKVEASSRASSERARAAALITAARKSSSTPSSSIASETPRSEYGYGYSSGSMYNRSETREAKMGWKDLKRSREERRW